MAKKIELLSKSMPSIISKDLSIEGEILVPGLIEIEGKIKGIIKGNSVVIREEGLVEGTIIAEFISIRGHFDGKISAQTIEILSSGSIKGEIEYSVLNVEDGASIDGHFKKIELDKSSQNSI